VGEIPNIIKNNSNGFIVAKDDLSEFYKSLKILILNKENRSNFGKSLNHTINKLYSSEINIGHYLSWLKQLNNQNEK
jgi:glycosyltransferase involved in cell wall biosynthesis